MNIVRARGGVAPLNAALLAKANQLATEKGYGELTMLGEIRRERACELYAEGHRLMDLCRWGVAEEALAGKPTCGVYLSYKGTDSYLKSLIDPRDNQPVYNPDAFPESMINQKQIRFEEYTGLTPVEAGCVIGDQVANRKFAKKDYLSPIPTDEIKLNVKLLQNPGW